MVLTGDAKTMWELKQRYIGYRVEQYNVPREVGEEATRSESTERT